MLASRPDIIREDYMNELCILQVILQSVSAPRRVPPETSSPALLEPCMSHISLFSNLRQMYFRG